MMHGGNWHRQVSLLSFEEITAFNEKGARVGNGAFGENIIVSGIDLRQLPVGTKMKIGDSELVVTQIGKECHKHVRFTREWAIASCLEKESLQSL